MGPANREPHRKHHWWGSFGVTWPKMGRVVVVVVAGHGKPNVPLRTVLFQGKVFLSSSGRSTEPPAQAHCGTGSRND